jgi:hypothetical protein
MDIYEPISKDICKPILMDNVTLKTSTKHFLLHVGDGNNIHKCNSFPTWARYQLSHTIQLTKFPKTTWIQTKQIVYTLIIIICTIDKKFAYIQHYNIHKNLKSKSFMKPKPNVVMEHLNIYSRYETCACILHYNMHKRHTKKKVCKNNLNINETNCLYTPHCNMQNR